jgi:hypothetical protein
MNIARVASGLHERLKANQGPNGTWGYHGDQDSQVFVVLELHGLPTVLLGGQHVRFPVVREQNLSSSFLTSGPTPQRTSLFRPACSFFA